MASYSQRLLQAIRSTTREVSLMEVCGTHTMAIARSGIRELLPPNIRLLSGPGCPVCVTSQGDIDSVIEMVRRKEVILITFGDMMRVPGTRGSLQEERSRGADVRVVYSPLEALRIARNYPQREVVFLGSGFETTVPAVAVTLEEAREAGLHNLSLFSLHKLVPPALELILSDPEVRVDGLICPGHVTAVTGLRPYETLAQKYRKPCVVTGFEPVEILEGIVMLIHQLQNSSAKAEIQYKRVVKPEGNPAAVDAIWRVFQTAPSRWRGLGMIPDSGLQLRDEYAAMDARRKFNLPEIEDIPIKGCICGAVLTGKSIPTDCALFGRSCTPLEPVGPCMVSQEGACAAYYRYAPGKGRCSYEN